MVLPITPQRIKHLIFMLSIIVAIADNNAIGQKGQLLCHLPDDLRHFKSITSGKTVMMGERTFLSLPKRPLPNRRNIVLTDQENKSFEGAITVHSLDDMLALAKEEEEAFIIGGGMVYRQCIPRADKLYITHIHHHFEQADTFFPVIDEKEWEKTVEEFHPADENNPYDYTFAEYRRR